VRHIHLFLAETSEAFFSLGWRFSSHRHFVSDFAILPVESVAGCVAASFGQQLSWQSI
jgi:hypothetical protein